MSNVTAYPYDLTNVTSTENIYEFILEVNKLSGDFFMLSMLIAGWIILFIAMKKTSGNQESMVASSFVTVILAIFFVTMDFISTQMMIFIVIICGLIITVFAIKSNDYG